MSQTLPGTSIEFDPRSRSHYRFAAEPLSTEAQALAAAFHPDRIPWPAGLAPTPQTITPTPAETDPIPQADVLAATYTVAEGEALADVLTPGVLTTGWTAYKMVGQHPRPRSKATALHGRAGLSHTTKIGTKTAVVFKSDLHPSTDGIQLPMQALWQQLIEQAKPRLVITTGTAAAVQSDTLLGDIIVAQHVRWDDSGHGRLPGDGHIAARWRSTSWRTCALLSPTCPPTRRKLRSSHLRT